MRADAFRIVEEAEPGSPEWEAAVKRLFETDPVPDEREDDDDPFGAHERITPDSAAAEELRARFPLLDLKALLDPNRPRRRWFLDGIVPEGDHASIVAPGGTGKSLLVLALAVAAVRGDATFLDRAICLPDDAKVFYVDKENSDEDWIERLESLGMTMEEADSLDRFMPLSFPPIGGLDTAQGADLFLRLLDAYGIGAGDVVILDSTQRVTEGPENDNDTMRAFYAVCGERLKVRGITVIRTDNTGHDQSRARGASAKADDIGYSWLLTRLDKGTGANASFALRNTKFRGLGDGEDLRFNRRHLNGITTFNVEVPEASVLVRGARERFQIAASNVLHDRKALHDAGAEVEPWLSQSALVKAVQAHEVDGERVSFNKNDVPGLLTDLVDGGFVSAKQVGQSTRYTWLRSYTGSGTHPSRHTEREMDDDDDAC